LRVDYDIRVLSKLNHAGSLQKQYLQHYWLITIGRTDKMHTNYVLQMKLHFGILFSG